jgi:hypothetical protein
MLIPKAACRVTNRKDLLARHTITYSRSSKRTAKNLLAGMPDSALERKVASRLDFSSPVLPSTMKKSFSLLFLILSPGDPKYAV